MLPVALASEVALHNQHNDHPRSTVCPVMGANMCSSSLSWTLVASSLLFCNKQPGVADCSITNQLGSVFDAQTVWVWQLQSRCAAACMKSNTLLQG